MIPNGTRFIGIAPEVDLKERGSALLNKRTEPYTIDDIRGYKVFTALLTQSGGDNRIVIDGGALTKGITYSFDGIVGIWDFSNLGGPKFPDMTTFVATSDGEPISFGAELAYNTGAPVVTVLENTIGNIWFTYLDAGIYSISSSELFTVGKSWTPTITIFNDTAGLRDGEVCEIRQDSFDEYIIATYDQTGIYIDNMLYNTPIEIRVYN